MRTMCHTCSGEGLLIDSRGDDYLCRTCWGSGEIITVILLTDIPKVVRAGSVYTALQTYPVGTEAIDAEDLRRWRKSSRDGIVLIGNF